MSRAELLAGDAALGAFDESEELGDLRVGLEIFVEIRGGFGEVEILFKEYFFVSAAECADIGLAETAALEANLVDAAHAGRVTCDDSEGRNVLRNSGESSGDRVCADTAELVHGGEARDDGVVFDMDVAGEGAIVRKDDVVADLAIVRDVAVGEEKIVRADASG